MSTIGKTSCGRFVFDRYGSHVDVPKLILKEALGKLTIPGGLKYTYTSIEFPTFVGHNVVVPTETYDDIFYAKRPGKNFLSRFARKDPRPTRFVSLELKQLDKIETEWLLVSSHLGDIWLPEIEFLEGKTPTEESLDFWNSHAFCWGYVAVIPRTITTTCPWES